MSYSADEQTAPDWMNLDFFEVVLKYFRQNESIKVKNIKIAPATLKGDHYASVMFRIKVEFEYFLEKVLKTEHISLILKTIPDGDSTKKDLLGDMTVFKTEIGMYSDTIPKFEELLRKAGDEDKLGAKLVYYSISPRPIIILEDLAEKGYDIIRDRRLTIHETKLAVIKIAKWHAASYILHNQGDKTIANYRRSLFSMTDLVNSTFLSTGVYDFTKMLTETKDLEMYFKKFYLLKDSLIAKCLTSTNAFFDGKEGLFVLNHGDFHIKNVMMNLREVDAEQDIKLVDFQLCSFSPAVYDLILMLYGIADFDTRFNHRDEVIYFYFQTFLDSLKSMGFTGDLPKFADLKTDFIKHRHLEVFCFVTFMPLILAGENLAGEMDTTAAVENINYRRNFYVNKAFVDEARLVLPMFLNQGYLD